MAGGREGGRKGSKVMKGRQKEGTRKYAGKKGGKEKCESLRKEEWKGRQRIMKGGRKGNRKYSEGTKEERAREHKTGKMKERPKIMEERKQEKKTECMRRYFSHILGGMRR